MPRYDPSADPKEYMKEVQRATAEMQKGMQVFGYPKFLPNGRQVSATIQQGIDNPGHGPVTIRVWDIATKEKTIDFNGYDGWPPEYSFSKDGRYLVAGPEGHSVHLWDIQSGKLLHVWKHDQPVLFVLISPDGSKVVTYPSGRSVALLGYAYRQREKGPAHSGDVVIYRAVF